MHGIKGSTKIKYINKDVLNMNKNKVLKKALVLSIMLILGLIISLIPITRASAATLYTLKAKANNNYVSADNYGDNPLIANRTSAAEWEQYQVINNTDGTISLLSMSNNKYVCADLNQGAKLVASSTSIQQWEKFKKVTLADGTIALQAMANNQFVSADLNSGGVLVANRGSVGGSWEAYTLEVVTTGDNSGQAYANQDFTAYTSPVGGITASGVSPTPYTTCAVHPSDRSNAYSAPIIPFGSIITTNSPIYLPGYGYKSNFVVQDKGDLSYAKSQYWVDIFFDYENNPNTITNAINYGNQKVSYSVSK
jgi:3D (Asp-Asp-Asp) domain-containing protein